MRPLHAMTLLLALAGCALGGTFGTDGRSLVPSMPGIDQEQAERLYAAGAPRLELVMVDRGTSALMIKVAERNGISTWRTIDNTQIHTRGGLVIGTRGMSFDMMSADTGGALAAILGGRTTQVQRFFSYLDGNDHIEIRAYVCDISPAGRETVEISGGPTVSGALVREVCYTPEGGFTNLYVVHDGRILKSLQFISDQVGRAQIVLLSW